METGVIKVGGMSCQGCVRNITGVLAAVPGVRESAVVLRDDLKAGVVEARVIR